jgi:hypothetical protein
MYHLYISGPKSAQEETRVQEVSGWLSTPKMEEIKSSETRYIRTTLRYMAEDDDIRRVNLLIKREINSPLNLAKRSIEGSSSFL